MNYSKHSHIADSYVSLTKVVWQGNVLIYCIFMVGSFFKKVQINFLIDLIKHVVSQYFAQTVMYLTFIYHATIK
jgi:hypothetical protein